VLPNVGEDAAAAGARSRARSWRLTVRALRELLDNPDHAAQNAFKKASFLVL
jgi:hypothetical protein